MSSEKIDYTTWRHYTDDFFVGVDYRDITKSLSINMFEYNIDISIQGNDIFVFITEFFCCFVEKSFFISSGEVFDHRFFGYLLNK